jgi:hypothetical protein
MIFHSENRFRGQAMFFLVTTLVSALVACGGGGSNAAPVAPAAPAALFTTAPTTTLAEGSSYTYSAHADDSAGGTVSYSLTASPDGAKLVGSEVDWTPLPSQVRTSNQFTLTATTSEGGTASQSWLVNASGPIQGTWIDTYWTGNAVATSSPNDLSESDDYPITALVPNKDGSFTNISGTGTENGHFTIHNVPAGYYWLSVGWNGGNFWTNSSTFDLGSDYTGRPYSKPVSCDTTLGLDISGLDMLATDSNLTLTAPSNPASGWTDIPAGSSDSYTGTMTFCFPTDASAAGTTYIIQQEPVTLNGFEGNNVPGPALSLPTFAAGATTYVPGELTRTNPQSLDIILPGAAWTASFTKVGPASATPSYFEASAVLQPFVNDRAAQSDWPLTLVDVWSESVPSSPIDAGTVLYNNPYTSETPSGLQVFQAFAEASDAKGDYSVGNGFATTTLQTGGFAPLMSPIQNPMMNGKSLFIAGAINSTSVPLSWTAPTTGLPPIGYEVDYSCVDQDESCTDNGSGAVYTSSTSIILPPGLLKSGHSYQFDITAMADSRANMASSPWRSGYPQAWADVVSAPLLINSGATSAPIQGHAAVAGVANKNVIRTRDGIFLVTKNGNKPIDAKARMLARFNHHRISQASKAGSTVK